MQHLPEQRQGTVLQADERGVSLVRVRFVKAHGDFTEGRELSVDPASAESLVERGLAELVDGRTEDEREADAQAEKARQDLQDDDRDPDDDPDTGDVTLPISDGADS